MMADFETDISRWVERARNQTLAAEAIVHAAAERLKELTPVVTGTLRAGWQVEQIGPNQWAITNNVEYARRINDGFIGTDSLGRQYDQDGQHMVEQVIAEMPTIAQRVIRGM